MTSYPFDCRLERLPTHPGAVLRIDVLPALVRLARERGA